MSDDAAIIQVGFSAGRGLGDAIRKFTGGDVNHAFILYHDPVLDLDVTFGANQNGFTMVPLRDFQDKTDRVVRSFTPIQTPLILGFRKNADWINKPYDLAGLVGMSVVEIESRILHMKGKNPFLDHHKLFCSEIVTIMLRSSGYTILSDNDPGTIDPYALSCAMQERPDCFQRREWGTD